MVTRISRPMEYAGRFGRQQADQAIKRDLIRALVELITNSDDSYRRMERQGISIDGQILIEIQRRRSGSIVRVTDFAEGMDGETLDRAVGTYADETSGFLAGEPVRGYFGRGIKDAILGLGEGIVTGTVDYWQHRASLGIRENEPYYEAQTPIRLDDARHSNSTVVEIRVTRDDIRIPQFDNLRTQLSLHFALRDITTSSTRTVILRNLNDRRSRREFQIRYQFPQSQQLLTNTYTLQDFGTSCNVQVYRADIPLDTPREQEYIAQAGLLIKGENAIFDNTLLKFDGDPNAQRLYGMVTCGHLDELLREGEPILLATRDGLDRSHIFVRSLFDLCEEILQPLVEGEAQRSRREQSRAQSTQLRNKLNEAVGRFNQIARDELADMQVLDPGEPEISVPETGFGFVPEYSDVLVARSRSLLLRGLTRLVPEGSSVALASDNPNVTVITPIVILEPREDFGWIGEARVRVHGNQVGSEAILTAECEGLIAEAMVRVVARREPREITPRRRRGLFNEVQFSDERDPRQRVRYDRESKNVIIAVNHASVKPYIRDVTGAGTDTPQGQVMLAELISETVCETIARHGIETGRFAAPVGGEVEATRVQQLRLQNQYSGLIHEVIVAPEFRS